jgi:putative membrane protein
MAMKETRMQIPDSLKSFLQRWVISIFAVLVASHLVKGIRYDSIGGLLSATLLLGILNTFVRPLMLLLSLPLLVFTLGLFTWVINALLLYWVGQMRSFHVESFGAAMVGALIISLVSIVLQAMTGSAAWKVKMQKGKRPPPPPPPREDPPGGNGPIIDV